MFSKLWFREHSFQIERSDQLPKPQKNTISNRELKIHTQKSGLLHKNSILVHEIQQFVEENLH